MVILSLVVGFVGGIVAYLFAPRLQKEYLESTIEEYKALNIRGLKTTSPFSVELERVYISLQAQSLERPLDDALSRHSYSLDELLGRHARLAIVGSPGSGKTTLLAYLTLTFARNLAKTGLSLKTKLLPILVPLRRLNPATGLPSFLADFYRQRGLRFQADFFSSQLRAGNCLVLLDGLDEVADENERRAMAEWVDELVTIYPKNRFVVTSRPAGYVTAPLTNGFSIYAIRDFEMSDVEQFVRNWYLAVEIAAQGEDNSTTRERAAELAGELIATIRNSKAIRKLAVNPLLVSIIALVHRYRAHLPERTVELYGECVDVLLGHWDEAKGLVGRWTAEQKRAILQIVAFEMYVRRARELRRAELVKLLSEKLPSVGRRSDEATDFLDEIRERSGLLVETAAGLYAFSIPLFQEYLTAKYLAQRQDGHNVLLEHLSDEWWHTIVLLYSGLRDATPIVESLLMQQGENRLASLLLAGQCLAEAVQVNPDARHRVISELERILLAESDLTQLITVAEVFGSIVGEHVAWELQVCREALACESLPEIAVFESRVSSLLPSLSSQFTDLLQHLFGASSNIARYLERDDRWERENLVFDALRSIERANEIADKQGSSLIRLVERSTKRWRDLIRAALKDLRGRAALKLRYLSDEQVWGPVVEVGVQIENVGDETAEAVDVSLLPSSDYAILETSGSPAYLPPRGKAIWTGKLRPFEQRPAKIEIVATYGQRGVEGRLETRYGDIVKFVTPDAYSFIPFDPNPYNPGPPLQDEELFFGRDDLIAQIARDFSGPPEQQNKFVMLYGQRRTGKSSLLFALRRRLKDPLVPVLYDLEGHTTDLVSLIYGLAASIADDCALAGLTVPRPIFDEFNDRPLARFQYDYLPKVTACLPNRRLLLMLDEFEYLEDGVRGGKLPTDVLPFLRNLIQNSRNLSFIFCGAHQLQELTTDYWDIFFNLAIPRRVTYLDEAATRQLILQPVEGHFTYDELAIRRLLDLTGGHPYFAQYLCYYLVWHLTDHPRGYVTINEVDTAVEEFINRSDPHLDWVWKQATEVEKAVLLALTHLTVRRGQPATQTTRATIRAKISEDFPAGVVDTVTAIGRLAEQEFLLTEGEKVAFRFGLIGEWLSERHSWYDLTGEMIKWSKK